MINSLIDFLNESPVNFLAVQAIAKRLDAAGYRRIDAADALPQLKAGDRIYVTKNDSSIYAFHIGREPMPEAGFRLICAHCDSPTFRIKPHAEMTLEGGITKLNTEVYGGPIMSTWFDRPLSLAGRVILRGKDALHPQTRLLHVKRPLLTIPNLAIHFNRQVNDGVRLSKQKDMLPILGIVTSELEYGNMLMQVITSELGVEASQVLDFDLYLYDTTPPCTLGLHNEFISAGRLDDLSMVHAGLEALLQPLSPASPEGEEPAPQVTNILAIFDNEETGSQTKQGAASPFLASMIERIIHATIPTHIPTPTQEEAPLLRRGGGEASPLPLGRGGGEVLYRSIEQAFMISADNAHAWHPNYSEKYDPTNHPLLGGGPVIKFNAAQKYASDAASAAVFAELCREAGVPCQRFVNHSDVAGGSTLGNILASSLPLRGVDMGNGVLAMHSVRELASTADHEYCIRAFTQFYRS